MMAAYLSRDLLMYGLVFIALIVTASLLYTFLVRRQKNPPQSYQGVVKRGWFPTGRIDFATHPGDEIDSNDQPREFRLLVEEQRIVESIAGNENLEIQWRHATVKEAKAVVTQYHRYLADHALVKSVLDHSPLASETENAHSAAGESEGASDPTSGA
jgi:hypothetical protein